MTRLARDVYCTPVKRWYWLVESSTLVAMTTTEAVLVKLSMHPIEVGQAYSGSEAEGRDIYFMYLARKRASRPRIPAWWFNWGLTNMGG